MTNDAIAGGAPAAVSVVRAFVKNRGVILVCQAAGMASSDWLVAALSEALHTRPVRHFTRRMTKANYNIGAFF